MEGGLSTFSPGCGLEGGARRALFPVPSHLSETVKKQSSRSQEEEEEDDLGGG